MADVTINAAIKITPDSIRKIQSDVKSAFSQISPSININEEAIKQQVSRALSSFRDIASVSIGKIKVTDSAVRDLSNFISQNVVVRFNKIEAARTALSTFQKQVQDQARIVLEAQASVGQAQVGARGSGARSPARGNLDAAIKKETEERQKLVELEIQAQVAQRRFNQVLKQEGQRRAGDARKVGDELQKEAVAIREAALAEARLTGVLNTAIQGIRPQEAGRVAQVAAEEAVQAARVVAAQAKRDSDIAAGLEKKKQEALKQQERVTKEAAREQQKLNVESQKRAKEARKVGDELQKEAVTIRESAASQTKFANAINTAARNLTPQERGNQAQVAAQEAARVAQAAARNAKRDSEIKAGIEKRNQQALKQQERETQQANKLERNRNSSLEAEIKSLERITGLTSSKAASLARQVILEKQAETQLAKQRRNFPGGGGGGAGSGGGDVRSAKPADPIAKGVEQKLGRVNRLLGVFRKNTAQGVSTTKTLDSSLKQGANSAQNFGAQVAIAARRLLAWAAPSALIFQTIARLREAIGEVIKLDTQARRLIFFQTAGNQSAIQLRDSLVAVGLAAEDSDFSALIDSSRQLVDTFEGITTSSGKIARSFDLIINTSLKTGIAIEDVTEALVTVSRVGERLVKGNQEIAGSFQVANSAFAEAVLNLVRLEGGALSAERAVRALVAIQAQFISTTGEFGDAAVRASIESQRLTNIANQLAVASAKTTANVEELTEATRRVGSAFRNVQGLSFDQVLAVISTSFELTGQSASRLSTALRQVSTLAIQNADDVKALTGIQLIDDATGQVRSFESILDVLEKIGEAQGTFRAEKIARTIGDRRNLDIILALGNNAERLRAEFESLSTVEGRLANAANAALQSLKIQSSLSEGLEANINRLNTAITSLAASPGIREFANAFVSGLTIAVQKIKDLSDFAKESGPVLAALAVGAGVGFVLLVRAVFDFVSGLRLAFSATTQLNAERDKSLALLTQETNREKGLTALVQQRFLTKQQALTLEKSLGGIQQQRVTIANTLLQIEAQEGRLDKNAINFEVQRNRLLSARLSLQRRENILQLEENKILAQGNKLASTRNKEQGIGGRGTRPGLATATSIVTAALVAGPQIEKALEESAGSGVAKGVSFAIQTAATGSALGPLGALAGLIAGIIGGVFTGVFEERIKEAKDNLGELEKINRGVRLRERAEQLNAFNEETRLGQQVIKLTEVARRQAHINRLKQLEDERGLTQEEFNLLTDLTDTQSRSVQLNESNLTAVEAQLGALAGIQEEERERVKQATTAQEKSERINALLKDTTRIQREILAAGIDTARVLTLQNVLREKFERLNVEGFEKSFQRNILEQERLRLQIQINQAKQIEEKFTERAQAATEILLSTFERTAQQRFDIQVQIDESLFERSLARLEGELREFKRAADNPISVEAGEEARKQLLKAQDEIEKIQISRVRRQVQQQQQLVESANQRAQEQIRAWQSASQAVGQTLGEVVDKQKGLADLFQQISNNVLQGLERSAERFGEFLENTGASVSDRLLATREAASRQIVEARRGTRSALSAIGEGFSDSSGIRRQTNALVNTIAEAGVRGLDKVFDKETNILDERLVLLRQREADERSFFDLRIRNTQQEIEIRKAGLQKEIAIIEQRAQSERELNQERLRQLTDFGKLIIKGPEEFNKIARDIAASGKFFGDITETNAEGIETLINRARNLRGAGQFEILQAIQRGLEARSNLGLDSPIAGVGLDQLNQIFTQAQFRSAGAIIAEIKQQRAAALRQTQLDEAADRRRAELESLVRLEAQIQQAQLQVSQADAAIAIRQRDQTRVRLEEIIRDQRAQATNLINVGIASIKLLEEIAASATGRRAGSILGDQLGGVIENIRTQALGDFEARRAEEEKRRRDEAEGREPERLSTSFGDLDASTRGLISTIDSVGDRLGGLFRGNTAGGPPGTSDLSTLGAGFGEVFNDISQSLKPLSNGRLQIRSPQIEELRRAIELSGGTRDQRNLLRQLERDSRRSIRGGAERQGQEAARRFLGNEQTAQRVEKAFRTLLQDRGGEDSQFVTELRALRGDRRSGVNAGATRRLLGGEGLGGLAEGATTSRNAARVIDRLLKLSDDLSKNQTNLSRDAGREISKILSEEITDGVRELREEVERIGAENRRAGQDRGTFEDRLANALQNFSIVAPEELEVLSGTLRDSIRGALESSPFSANLAAALTNAITNSELSVNVPELAIALSGNVSQQIQGDEFLEKLTIILREQAGLSDEQIATLQGQIAKIAKVLVDTGQLSPVQ